MMLIPNRFREIDIFVGILGDFKPAVAKLFSLPSYFPCLISTKIKDALIYILQNKKYSKNNQSNQNSGGNDKIGNLNRIMYIVTWLRQIRFAFPLKKNYLMIKTFFIISILRFLWRQIGEWKDVKTSAYCANFQMK